MKILEFLAKLLNRTTKEDIVGFICGSEALPKPLLPEQERELLLLSAAADASARNTLIEHNLRLVVFLAKKFENSGFELEDLVSVGTIGLIKAVNSFNLDKNIKLATYASRCIENEILMFLRKAVRQKMEVSLDEPLNTDSEGNELLLCDIIGTDADSVYRTIEQSVELELLGNCIAKLSHREQQIVLLRFGLFGVEEKTQKEVATLLGISQSYISRLEKKIVSKLRKEIAKIV